MTTSPRDQYLINIRHYCRANVDLTEDPACVEANESVIKFIDKKLAPTRCTSPGNCPTPRGYVCGGCARGY